MGRVSSAGLLRRAAREHRRLERLTASVSEADPAAVLQLGTSVLLHGLFEEAHLFTVHRLLDPAVREELSAEHERIRDGLSLLEDLLSEPSPSEDLRSRAAAVARRLRDHVARDGRVLYSPLERMNLPDT
jgi:hypothetical protein